MPVGSQGCRGNLSRRESLSQGSLQSSTGLDAALLLAEGQCTQVLSAGLCTCLCREGGWLGSGA